MGPKAKADKTDALADTSFVLLLQESSHVLKRYSENTTRIPLDKMACSPLNRGGMGVSGKHAHDIFRLIASRDGLVVFRYTRGICLAPNPDKPFENADFTNEYVSKSRDLLAPVTRTHLPGSISKSHLWHSCLTAKNGTFAYYTDGTPMVPNLGDPEMVLTLAEGLFFEKLSYDAYKYHPKAIDYLMKGENADAAIALAETEMSLIRQYFTECRRTVVPNGSTLLEAVGQSVQGGSWNSEFKVAAITFASLMGEFQMKALVDTYQYFVNPKTHMIGISQLTRAIALPVRYPWAKTVVVIANLLGNKLSKDKLGDQCRGDAVPDSSLVPLVKLQTLGLTAWEDFEKSIGDVMALYDQKHLQAVDSHTVLTLSCSHANNKVIRK